MNEPFRFAVNGLEIIKSLSSSNKLNLMGPFVFVFVFISI